MPEVSLSSNAEKFAEKAEELNSFSGLKLLHIKKQLAKILAQIGKDGIFDEYTKHDISHIDYMLESLDWLIPKKTQEKLTYSNWLMLTLSIYFHDLGMLVTKEEFEDRLQSEFVAYKRSIEEGQFGLDYRSKIMNISPAYRRDRFIYQEFVRRSHAERIKYWILDEPHPSFRNKIQVAEEIKDLLSKIDPMFRRDLALVCESHHLSDLDDFNKYKVDQQYGTSSQEIVNLHYTALILRTADLLHITSDRTPSIEFKLINPTDPISQDEWAKQNAVKTVRPQSKQNKDGEIDGSIESDTLEVIAYFEDENGFFGLISYINYANKQLKENFDFNESSKKAYGTDLHFPWRKLDDSSIQTRDFEKRQFEFVLDQTKILDLLVGHTLYSDSSVVLRELTQNAIDSVKFKSYEMQLTDTAVDFSPNINVRWNKNENELSFIDNGTGMTLEIIENHLLKVGSSRYQEPGFKKRYPDFSPISRFGIGLLTCFLIADDIDIITKSAESEKAILLKIRKIHGKYLLKHVSIENLDSMIQDHGTIIKLYVRADIDQVNVKFELEKWVLFPSSNLQLDDNGETYQIGFKNPKKALERDLHLAGLDTQDPRIKIKEINEDGISMAFALGYAEHWKEWNLIKHRNTEEEFSLVGTCIEGIRVDFNTPGFEDLEYHVLVNATGKNAPKTNVARSNLEITLEKRNLLLKVYQIYLQHITSELQNLISEGFSITWAANEANWMVNNLIVGNRGFTDQDKIKVENLESFDEALSSIQCLIVEREEKRELVSFNDLKSYNHFWTIDCASYYSANSLIKEIKSSKTSALTLLNTLFSDETSHLEHIDCLLCNEMEHSTVLRLLDKSFQVDKIKIIPEQRRLDLRYALNNKKIWEKIELTGERSSYDKLNNCFIQVGEVDIDKSVSETAIRSRNALYILKESELNNYLVKLINQFSKRSLEDQMVLSMTVSLLSNFFYYRNLNIEKIEEVFKRDLEHNRISEIFWNRVDKQELIDTILTTTFIKYDTTIWHRRYY